MSADPLGGLGPSSAPPGPPTKASRAPPKLASVSLLLLCGAGFLAQAGLTGFTSTDDALAAFRLGALTEGTALGGEWWRLGAYTFLHFGVVHLLFNSWALSILARPLEGVLSSPLVLGIFCASALGGGALTAAWWHSKQEPLMMMAGASGGIFGLLAAQGLVVFRLRRRLPRPLARALLLNFAQNLGLNLFITFAVPGISATGHLGGLLVGALFALALPLPQESPRPWHRPAIWLVLGSAFVLFSMEGAAVARAVRPRSRPHSMGAVRAELPWMLIPLGGDEFAAPGGGGLFARLESGAPFEGDDISLGHDSWRRQHAPVSSKGERIGEEVSLVRTDGVRVLVQARDPDALGRADSLAREIAISITSR